MTGKSEASSYVVIARKWRPQTFDDVVGQKTITQTLQNAIRSNRVAHAFLFSGARGVGKTTTARILAKALNCHRGPTAEPCGECVSCAEIAAGNSLDVLEIDAASNRGIDNIRQLRETIQYRTARDRFKIFIIDEAHMLSNEAFNALLKTLEEPPEHVKFILATTEPHRIPPTIHSRCQQFEFKMIPYQQILDRLRMIVDAEGIRISDYALRLICTSSQGSMRDAQSALDQVLAYSGVTVQDADVRSLLGVVGEELLNGVVQGILSGDRRALLDRAAEASRHGHNLQLFCRKLLEHVRHMLVIKAAGFEPEMISVSAGQGEELTRQSEGFSEVDLLRIYDLLSRAEGELRWHPHPLFHLEITLLKILQLRRLEDIERLLSGPAASQPGRAPAATAPAPGKVPARPASPLQPALPATTEAEGGPAAEAVAPEGDPQVAGFLRIVREERPALSAFLESAQLRPDPGGLGIRFTEKQKISKERVEQAANLEFLQKSYARAFGTPGAVRIETDGAAEKPAPAKKRHRAMEDPRVKLFTDAFPGKISIEDLED